MWAGQGHHLDIIVRYQSLRLIICVAVAIGTETGLVDDHVCYVLCMFNRLARVVDVTMALSLRCMEAELHLIDAIGEAEEGEVCSLDGRDEFFTLAIILCSLIESGDSDEVSKLLGCSKLAQFDSLVHLVVEGHIIESLLKVHSVDLIIDECLLRREEEILLEWFT